MQAHETPWARVTRVRTRHASPSFLRDWATNPLDRHLPPGGDQLVLFSVRWGRRICEVAVRSAAAPLHLPFAWCGCDFDQGGVLRPWSRMPRNGMREPPA